MKKGVTLPLRLPVKRVPPPKTSQKPPPKTSQKPPPPLNESDEFNDSKLSRIIEFKKHELLGRGTYGKVYKAEDKRYGRFVAVKQLKMEKEREGFPLPAIREVMILKMVDHKNIVKLFDIIASIRKPKFWMIFEYVDHDLMGLLNAKIKFNESTVRHFMRQILEGVFYMHKMKIVHRDLKTSNLLITRDGVVKIADFGLARILLDHRKHYTNKIVTRWYRSPELLLGETEYDYAIDMWSVGCIFAELLGEGKALFRGKNVLDQLHKIFDICGTPSLKSWPGASKLRHWSEMKPKDGKISKLKKLFAEKYRWSENALDLLERLLTIDPSKRITAQESLNHAWFRDRTLNDGRALNIPREGNYNELRAQTGGGEGMDRGAIVGKKRYRESSSSSGGRRSGGMGRYDNRGGKGNGRGNPNPYQPDYKKVKYQHDSSGYNSNQPNIPRQRNPNNPPPPLPQPQQQQQRYSGGYNNSRHHSSSRYGPPPRSGRTGPGPDNQGGHRYNHRNSGSGGNYGRERGYNSGGGGYGRDNRGYNNNNNYKYGRDDKRNNITSVPRRK